MNNQLATTNSQPVAFNFFDPQQFETLQRIAKMFANSELVPDMYRTTATNPADKAMANCMIAFNLAQRLQADTLMVMQNLVIIYGRPSWSSKFLISTVNTCGRFEPLEYQFGNDGKVGKIPIVSYEWQAIPNSQKNKKVAVKKIFEGDDIDNLSCYAYTTKKGGTKQLKGTVISIKMAIEEGWYTKDGSKWVTMAQQMLMYRAASFWTNAYAPELSMGMRTVEESEDMGPKTEDTTYTEVVDEPKAKVENDIANNANKTSITFDPAATPDPDPVQPDPGATTGTNQVDPANNTAPDTVQQNQQQPDPKNIANTGSATGESNPGGLFKSTSGPGFN